MDQLPIKIKIGDYWKPKLRALLFYFFYLIKPRFYYISAGLMGSTSHGDVSMMKGTEVYTEFNTGIKEVLVNL